MVTHRQRTAPPHDHAERTHEWDAERDDSFDKADGDCGSYGYSGYGCVDFDDASWWPTRRPISSTASS